MWKKYEGEGFLSTQRKKSQYCQSHFFHSLIFFYREYDVNQEFITVYNFEDISKVRLQGNSNQEKEANLEKFQTDWDQVEANLGKELMDDFMHRHREQTKLNILKAKLALPILEAYDSLCTR